MNLTRLINAELALFVGAGVSIAPPTRLPSFQELRDETLAGLIQGLELEDLSKDRVSQITTKPELLLQTMWDYYGETVNPIEGFGNVPPNENHHLIAAACSRGVRLVITTNFDRCIERALETHNIAFTVYPHTPADEQEALQLQKLLTTRSSVLVWKPHGDCGIPKTLCYTIEKVAQLNSSKFLRSMLQIVLGKYNLMTLGYSGYDDDLFPLLYDFPIDHPRHHTIYWNIYGKLKEGSPAFNLRKVWKGSFVLLEGDARQVLGDALGCSGQTVRRDAPASADPWQASLQNEIEKISPDGRVAILGQYYHRLQLYDEAQKIWKAGLHLDPLGREHRLRFLLNLTNEDQIQLENILAEAVEIGSFPVAEVALIKLIVLCVFENNFKLARKYLKQYKGLAARKRLPEYFYGYYHYSADYLKAKYKGNKRRINRFVLQLRLKWFEESFQGGQILEAIKALAEYVSALAEEDHVDSSQLVNILKYVPILESYNLPYDMAGLYYSVAIAAVRLEDNKTSLAYINLCEAQTRKCHDAGMYSHDRFNELMAEILHHKSMLGDAKSAIDLCKDSLRYLDSVEDKSSIFPSYPFFLGLYNSSIAANYLVLRKYKEAEEYAITAIHYHQQANDLRGEARTLLTLANTYLCTGRKMEGRQVLRECWQKHMAVGQNTARVQKLMKEFHITPPSG
jgi:hypothetical protein